VIWFGARKLFVQKKGVNRDRWTPPQKSFLFTKKNENRQKLLFAKENIAVKGGGRRIGDKEKLLQK